MEHQVEFTSVVDPASVAKIIAAEVCPNAMIPAFYNTMSKKWQLDGSNDIWLHVLGKPDAEYHYRLSWRAYAKVPDHIKVPATFKSLLEPK